MSALSQIRRGMYRGGALLGDVQAVRRGRVGRRIVRRGMWRLFGRLMRRAGL